MPDYEVEFEEEDFQTQFNGKTLLRIFQQARPHRLLVVVFLGAITGVSVLDAVFTYLSKRIIDEGIVAKDPQAMTHLFILYGALIFVQALGVFTFIYVVGRLGESIQYDLRQKSFARLQALSLSYYTRTPVGWIMSRVTSDTQRIADLISWGVLDTMWGLISISTSVVFMVFINWKLALIVFMVIPVLIVVAVQFKKYILIEFRKVRKLNSKITGAYNENITGVRVSKALAREEANLDEFGRLSGGMYAASFKASWLSALFLPVVQVITAIAIGSIAWYGGLQTVGGWITVGGIQAFISYVTFMLWPIQEMARVYAEMQRSIASAERVFSLIDAVPEVHDREEAADPGTLRGDIEFHDVEFYYDPEKPVIPRLNLHIRRGETIALVGPTGGGKTTLVNLVCRFYEPVKGKITIGGRDYTGFSLHGIQSRIGVVLQTPHLFSGTIRENIRYGKLDATAAEIEAAAKMAGAHEFISQLEKGYEAEVGEGGVLLSVGQKQLISLTRAILAHPEIFIMDEATSSVDTLTEALIQKGMEVLMEDRTSIIIAHRLSTIKRADRILVIENGGIKEMGTHAELLRQRGHYYRLYTQQFREKLVKDYNPYEMLPLAAD